MGFNAEFTVILREIVQFLECLREAKLSSALETIRENLLARSKDTLNVFTTTEGSPPTTEEYLNMNSTSKGLLAIQTNELDGQEYVRCEESPKTEDQQNHPTSQIPSDYYETFLSVTAEDEKKKEQEKIQENELLAIYYGLSASQAKSKSLKCGPLYRKEGKKLFVFEQFRTSWVALIGSHLLIYGSKRDSKPHLVQEIRGYSGRPAPNSVARDPRRSEAAFEIFKPGSKTLQFIATTAKDMEQWVAHICQLGSYGKTTTFDYKCNSKEELSTETIVETEEIVSLDRPAEPKLQSTFAPVNETKAVEPDPKLKVIIADKNYPQLPMTLSRKLPSLPKEQVIPSYEMMNDEEDNLYQKIGDLGNKTYHQNSMTNNQHEKSKDCIYDDCPAIVKKEYVNVKFVAKEVDVSNMIPNERQDSFNGIYDDIGNVSDMHEKNQVIRSGDTNDTCESQSSAVTTMISNDETETSVKASSPGTKNKDEIQKILPNKKSFLDRMRNKKESPQKKEKIVATRRETLSSPKINETNETPMYDDVTNLIIGKGAFVPEETCEYNCPPIPRPVYNKPSVMALPEKEAIYDDIRGYHQKKDQLQLELARHLNAHNLENNISDDNEHYKAPRSRDMRQQAVSSQTEEQLYDDIAILANFTARQRKISEEIKDQDTSKPLSSPDKRAWNKFVTNRKSRTNDCSSSGLNRRTSSDISDPDVFEEQLSVNKKNTIQKLINKMENSLGKVSPRTAPVTSMNKSCGLNTSS